MVDSTGYELAPLGRRVAAWLVDATFGTLLAACFIDAVGGGTDLHEAWHMLTFKSLNGPAGRQLSAAMHPTSSSLSALGPLARLLAILMVMTVAAVAYRVVTTAKWGAGLGKMLLGLRVVVDRPDAPAASPPGWARSWKRWGVPQLPGLIPLPATGLLAYLPALRDARRRGLHDRAAGTIVIDTRRLSPTVVGWTVSNQTASPAELQPSEIAAG
ncbi:MAG TPA: RDD family protein [Mycobacteriales bacterium]|nr:RDD family protein [Mycobacteriales bacterium]